MLTLVSSLGFDSFNCNERRFDQAELYKEIEDAQ